MHNNLPTTFLEDVNETEVHNNYCVRLLVLGRIYNCALLKKSVR